MLNKQIDGLEGDLPDYTLELDESFIDIEEDFEKKRPLTTFNYENDIHKKNIIALNSNIVGYCRDYGLDFDNHFGYKSKKLNKQNKFQYAILKDTYEEHINWMLEIYNERYTHNMKYPIRKINDRKYQSFNFDELMKFIIIMHDYGKLNNTWQQIVSSYQKAKQGSQEDYIHEFLAHTDYDPSNKYDQKLLTSIYSSVGKKEKPPHAGVGAMASLHLLPEKLGLNPAIEEHISLVKVIITTILRHHGAYTKSFDPYEISDPAVLLTNEIFERESLPFTYDYKPEHPLVKCKGDNMSDKIITFTNAFESFLYFILVRILRLCDQHSFEKNPRYPKEAING